VLSETQEGGAAKKVAEPRLGHVPPSRRAMNTSDGPPARFRLAIALSIAAHVCGLLLLAVLLDDRFIAYSSDRDFGPASFITTIEHRLRRPATNPRHARSSLPAPISRGRRAGPLRPSSPAPPAAASHPAASTGGVPFGRTHHLRPRPTLALVEPTEAPTVAPTAPPTAKPILAAAPSPVPQATRSPAAVLAASFGGLFSADYPPALSTPSDAADVRALLGGPARVRVDVDETGRATDVRFISPISDPQIEAAVRDKLLSLHYVPADCNGLHCDGTFELRF
jgi:hypothetical protein